MSQGRIHQLKCASAVLDGASTSLLLLKPDRRFAGFGVSCIISTICSPRYLYLLQINVSHRIASSAAVNVMMMYLFCSCGENVELEHHHECNRHFQTAASMVIVCSISGVWMGAITLAGWSPLHIWIIIYG